MFWIVLIFMLIPTPILILAAIAIACGVVIFIYKLATDKESGEGTVFAIALFSASKGNAESMMDVGRYYLKGEGVQQNLYEAVSWFKKAAENGHGGGARSLAVMHRNGLGVERNIELAAYWYQRAEALGMGVARDDIAEMVIEAHRQTQEEVRQRQEKAQYDNQQERQRHSAGDGDIDRKLALEILDLKEDATRQQIEAAYKRMMIKNHPDAGGSNYFAKQLNAAREVLLRAQAA